MIKLHAHVPRLVTEQGAWVLKYCTFPDVLRNPTFCEGLNQYFICRAPKKTPQIGKLNSILAFIFGKSSPLHNQR